MRTGMFLINAELLPKTACVIAWYTFSSLYILKHNYLPSIKGILITCYLFVNWSVQPASFLMKTGIFEQSLLFNTYMQNSAQNFIWTQNSFQEAGISSSISFLQLRQAAVRAVLKRVCNTDKMDLWSHIWKKTPIVEIIGEGYITGNVFCRRLMRQRCEFLNSDLCQAKASLPAKALPKLKPDRAKGNIIGITITLVLIQWELLKLFNFGLCDTHATQLFIFMGYVWIIHIKNVIFWCLFWVSKIIPCNPEDNGIRIISFYLLFPQLEAGLDNSMIQLGNKKLPICQLLFIFD